MFASLAMVVYFADHLAHSIQVDAIGKRVEHDTLAVVHGRMGRSRKPHPPHPRGRSALTAAKSGYLQTVHPELLLPLATEHRVHIRLRVRVGEHIVAGTTLGWMWTPTPDDRPRPSGVPPRTGRISPHRLRTHAGTGRRVRHPATRRHGLQGTVPRGERPLHRRPGRRPALGDLLRAGRPPARATTSPASHAGLGRSSCPAGGSATTWHHVRADPPLRLAANPRCRWPCSGCWPTAPPSCPTTPRGGPRSANRPT